MRQLESAFGFADLTGATELLVWVDAAEELGMLTTEAARVWRSRLRRTSLGVRGRPAPDPEIRRRCLADLDARARLPSDAWDDPLNAYFDANLITREDATLVINRLFGDEVGEPPWTDVLGVGTGPAAQDSMRVLWAARLPQGLRIGLRYETGGQDLQRAHLGDVLDTEYSLQACDWDRARGNLAFTPAPPASEVTLEVGDRRFDIAVP